ncbi:hypothetical protein [Streptomyces palmae]|nr:hypothetical protein [Streptomyces palmae]
MRHPRYPVNQAPLPVDPDSEDTDESGGSQTGGCGDGDGCGRH